MIRLAIARGLPEHALLPALEAALEGGFAYLEVTMNTPGAEVQISRARRHFGPRAKVGAGTVCTPDEARKALQAGAQFLVSPNTRVEVIRLAREAGVEVFPGALTPTEVFQAWESGATMVKVFPVSALGGPQYIKELRGPYAQIPLLACGGVKAENWKEYEKSGAQGIALGASLFRPEWIAQENWNALRDYAGQFFP